MKALPLPHTIVSEGNLLFYCRTCNGYRAKAEFTPSSLKRKLPCRSCAKKQRRCLSVVEKILAAVKTKIAHHDRRLARRWEVADVERILARGVSDLSGATSEKMSVVQRDNDSPFTPDNSLLVTRFEAMGRHHRMHAC